MAPSAPMNVRAIGAAGAIAAVTSVAHADTPSSGMAATLGGAHAGWVRSVEGDAPREDGTVALALRFDAVSPALAQIVAAWLEGRTLKTDLAVTSAAVLRKADGARIASIRLPALGFGAPEPFAIGFEAMAITSAPRFVPESDRAVPRGDRIAAFRLDVAGKPAAVVKLGELSLKRGPSGVAPTELALEVDAGEARPWIAWGRSGAAKAIRIDYVAADDRSIVRLALDGCRATAVKPTNGPTSRVALACASARRGDAR